MAKIRARDTRPEILLRKMLHASGVRFRLHSRQLPGRPDLVLAKHHAVIFVDGCFWHRHGGCKFAYTPKSKVAFWNSKFADNVARDICQRGQLRQMGWRVLIVWECALRSAHQLPNTATAVLRWLRSRSCMDEIPALGERRKNRRVPAIRCARGPIEMENIWVLTP